MRKGKPKTPYVLIWVGILANAFAMTMAIIFFLFAIESAANFAMKLLMSLIPIIAAIVVFIDMRFKLKDIKAYRQMQ